MKPYINIYKLYGKNVDGDSRLYLKGKANRRWWESGASKIYLNITPELQYMKGIGRLVMTDGIRPLQGRHMLVCLGGLQT